MLDLKKYFTIGEKIQILYISPRGQEYEYVSQAVEIHANGFVDILIPIHKTQDMPLRTDGIIKLVIPKGEAVYELKAAIADRINSRVPLLRLKIIAEVDKIQRRDFYRLKMMKDVEVRPIENLEEKPQGGKTKCNLHDISAGGLLFSTNKEFREGDMLELTLDLSGMNIIVYGIVVRRTLTVSHKAPYSYGVRFDRISELDKNKITKYIFEEQRKLIKKGLI